jgi:hypothetical protein
MNNYPVTGSLFEIKLQYSSFKCLVNYILTKLTIRIDFKKAQILLFQT